jgi:hypothetical protein
MCRDYTPGTLLPVANKFDEFIICGNHGKSTLMRCKPGFQYNALTTYCQMSIEKSFLSFYNLIFCSEPCAMDSTLCKNNGHCVDETTNKKGFQCICSIEYQGEYCDKRKQINFA